MLTCSVQLPALGREKCILAATILSANFRTLEESVPEGKGSKRKKRF